jgi:hypothetical protein
MKPEPQAQLASPSQAPADGVRHVPLALAVMTRTESVTSHAAMTPAAAAGVATRP